MASRLRQRKRQQIPETMPIPDKPQRLEPPIPKSQPHLGLHPLEEELWDQRNQRLERESGPAYHLFQNNEGKYFWRNNPKTKGQQFETVEEAINAMQGTEAWKEKSFQDLYGPNASRRAQTPEDWKALRKLREEYENRLRRRGEFVLKRGGKVSNRKNKGKGGGKVFYGYKKGGQV